MEARKEGGTQAANIDVGRRRAWVGKVRKRGRRASRARPTGRRRERGRARRRPPPLGKRQAGPPNPGAEVEDGPGSRERFVESC